VMIAILILAIGLAGLLPVILVAMNNNTGSRQDSQAVMIAQMAIETIASRPASSDATFTVTDCRPTSFGGPQTLTINTVAADSAAGGQGAPLSANGSVDFSSTAIIPAGYSMTFFACGDTGSSATIDNTQIPFDVRWNVMNSTANTNGLKLVTVAARRRGVAGGGLQSLLYSQPVTLRTIVGD